MGTIFKVFIEFVTILLLNVSIFWPQGRWDFSSPTRDGIPALHGAVLTAGMRGGPPSPFLFSASARGSLSTSLSRRGGFSEGATKAGSPWIRFQAHNFQRRVHKRASPPSLSVSSTFSSSEVETPSSRATDCPCSSPRPWPPPSYLLSLRI